MSVPPPSGTIYHSSPRGTGVQPPLHHFGNSPRASVQIPAGGIHGGVPGGPGNQGWLDWVGTYVNNAQTRVLERIDGALDHFEGVPGAPGAPGVPGVPGMGGAAGGPAPTLPWTPPLMQPLADDPDVRRQTQTRSESQTQARGALSDAHVRVQAHMRNVRSDAQARSSPRRDFDVDPLIGRRPLLPMQRQADHSFGAGTPTPTPTPLVVTSVPM